MHISILVLVGLLVGAFVFGVAFGWNNGKSSLINKLPQNLKDAVNLAIKK